LIDFRYHVVSIIAVFLALTVGLVLGSSFLGHEILDSLHHQVNGQNNTISQLRNTQNQMLAQLNYDKAAIQDLTPEMLHGQLTGQSAAVLVLPEGSGGDIPSSINTMLGQAGAVVQTQVSVNGGYIAPDAQLAAASKATHLTLPPNLASASPQQQIAAEITAVLTSKLPTGQGSNGTATQTLTHKQITTAMDALKSAGIIDFQTVPTSPAQLVVVVSGDPNSDNGTADQDNAGYLELLRALQTGEGSPVVAGTAGSAASHGLIAAMLADNWTAKNVSSVDNADQALGQVSVIYALVLQQAQLGNAKHYGTSGITDGPVPQLQPLSGS
jgi:hypothetical protein